MMDSVLFTKSMASFMKEIGRQESLMAKDLSLGLMELHFQAHSLLESSKATAFSLMKMAKKVTLAT